MRTVDPHSLISERGGLRIVTEDQSDSFLIGFQRIMGVLRNSPLCHCGHSQTMPPKAIKQPISVSISLGTINCSPFNVSNWMVYTAVTVKPTVAQP